MRNTSNYHFHWKLGLVVFLIFLIIIIYFFPFAWFFIKLIIVIRTWLIQFLIIFYFTRSENYVIAAVGSSIIATAEFGQFIISFISKLCTLPAIAAFERFVYIYKSVAIGSFWEIILFII